MVPVSDKAVASRYGSTGHAVKRPFPLRKNIIFAALMIMSASVFLGATSCHNGKSCTMADDNRQTMMTLFRQGKDAAMKKDFRKSDSLGNVLLHLADISDNDECRVRGMMCLGYSMVEAKNEGEGGQYLLKAERLLGNISNDTLAAEFYNLMGAMVFHDFDRAKEYFSRSLYAARKTGSETHQMMAECNLAEIYRSTGDTLGIQYDLDIHDFAIRTGNEVMRHASAVRCAEYYMKQPHKLSEATKYINEIRDMPGKEFYYHYLRSKWLMSTDSLDKAMAEWQKASKTGIATPGFLLAGGRLYQHHGDYGMSETLLVSADSAYSVIDSLNTDRIEIQRLRSENLRRLGKPAQALEMLESYQMKRDSVQKTHNTREHNAFKVKFETEKKELVIASQRASLRWRNILLIMSLLFIIALIAGFWMYIRRRNRFYRLIVEQQREFTTRQNEYAPYLKKEEVQEGTDVKDESDVNGNTCSDAPAPEKVPDTVASCENPEIDSTSGTPPGLPGSEKADAIWREILTEMEKNRIYADPDVTRDMFAERVHTNHTWLTAIIKHRTGKSYTQFMNSWRINEAVRILSQKELSLNNKELAEYLGFMTPQSFYTAFRLQMGMSPSRFRSDILASDT